MEFTMIERLIDSVDNRQINCGSCSKSAKEIWLEAAGRVPSCIGTIPQNKIEHTKYKRLQTPKT